MTAYGKNTFGESQSYVILNKMRRISNAACCGDSSGFALGLTYSEAKSRLLSAFIVAGVFTCMFFFLALQPAQAQVNDVFQTPAGTTAGEAVNAGTDVTYTVVSEPSEGQPGTVKVGGAKSGEALPGIDKEYDGELLLPEAVENEGASYQVTAVAKRAFWYSKISSVRIPDTITRLGEQAFADCYSLGHLEFGNAPSLEVIGTRAFCLTRVNANSGEGLEELVIPASVQTIGSYAFSGQSTFSELRFAGQSIQKIDEYAFSNCLGLVLAEIPEVTGEEENLSNTTIFTFDKMGLCGRTFYGCTALETAIFKGKIAYASTQYEQSTRNFEQCPNLSTVVYWDKKFIPTYLRHGGDSVTDTIVSFKRGWIENYTGEPTLYYTITYYPSKEAALAKEDALGYVRVRSDMALENVQAGMALQDDAGDIVYEGSVPNLPEGASGWAYEGAPALSDSIPDSLYAYAVDAKDFTYASMKLSSRSWMYTGNDIHPLVTVVDAAGKRLIENEDYTITYERRDTSGYKPTEDLASLGLMRVVVTPAGDYCGEARYAEYTIDRAQLGSCFEDDGGITYKVVSVASANTSGTAVVGDGSERAVDISMSGDLVIPEVAFPAGSEIRYTVVGISNHAFGGRTEEGACTQLESIVLPPTVKSIGVYAFGFCNSLKRVNIPASVENIDARAFENCTSLSDLAFEGDDIDSIGIYAFAQCAALTALELPSLPKASSLGQWSFQNCVKLQRLTFKGDVHPSDSRQFAGCERLTRVVFGKEVWEAAFDTERTSLYALVDFYASQAAADVAEDPLAKVAVRLQTKVSQLTPSLGMPYVLDAYDKVPALPANTKEWQLASGESVVTKPGKAFAAGTSAVPVPEASKTAAPKVGTTVTVGSGAAAVSYTVTGAKTVAYAKAPNAKKVVVPATVSIGGYTYAVTSVKAKAFAKAKKCRTVVVKSKTITSFKKAFKGSKVTKVKVPKAIKKAYKKLLTKKKCGKKVKVS